MLTIFIVKKAKVAVGCPTCGPPLILQNRRRLRSVGAKIGKNGNHSRMCLQIFEKDKVYPLMVCLSVANQLLRQRLLCKASAKGEALQLITELQKGCKNWSLVHGPNIVMAHRRCRQCAHKYDQQSMHCLLVHSWAHMHWWTILWLPLWMHSVTWSSEGNNFLIVCRTITNKTVKSQYTH